MIGAALAEVHAAFARNRGQAESWLGSLRNRGLERLQTHGLPNRLHEEWKYTSLRAVAEFQPSKLLSEHGTSDASTSTDSALEQIVAPLIHAADITLVLVDGVIATGLSRIPALTAGLRISPLFAAQEQPSATMQTLLTAEPAAWHDHPFAALNQAFLDRGTWIDIAPGLAVESCIHLIHVTRSSGASLCPRTLITLGEQAQAQVIESFVAMPDAAYLIASRVDIALAQGAKLLHIKTQQETAAGIHAGLSYARLSRDANLHAYAHSQGGRLIRNDLAVDLNEPGAEVTIDGLYLADGSEHVDNHTIVDHKVPNTTSSQTYKGVLKGRARAVFNGRVHVRKDAQQTNARQLNRNLLLTDEVEVDTKPELQIDANDVKCSHGATVGQLRSDEVFYLQSRGLTHAEAMAMLSAAFADEVMLKLPHAASRDRLRHLTKDWLSR